MLQDVLDNLHGKENNDEMGLMEHIYNKFNITEVFHVTRKYNL
jgi:hypothetical protein